MKEEKVPRWLKSRLSEKELDAIEEAVRQAERRTSGEIVPVILRRSATVGHIPFVVFLLLLVVYLGFGVSHWFAENVLDNHWLTLGYVVLSWLVSRWLANWEWLERVLTPKADQQQQVEQRAELEFFESRIKATEGGTGILLFLSLMERQAVVLADRAIAEKLPQEKWREVVQLMIENTRAGAMGEGLRLAVLKCGETLAEHFPAASADRNELPNHLVIKEY